MWTIDRIRAIAKHYNTIIDESLGLHKILDDLDTEAGMDTRGCTCRCHWRAEGIPVNQVGARIWRHERRIDGAHLYHHLGASASTA